MIPRQIGAFLVGADKWEVWEVPELTNEEGIDLYGQCDSDNRKILLSADYVERQAATLLHEMLHAIADSYGLGLDERAVRVLEIALVQAGVSVAWFNNSVK